MAHETFSHARLGADIPNGQIELDGIRYWTAPLKETKFEDDGMILVFEGSEIVNRCDHCHRFDSRPRMASSWEEAIAKEWVTRVCNYEDTSSAEDIAANQYVAGFECGAVVMMGNLKGISRAAVKARHPWLPHECRLEQIPGDPTSVRVIGVQDG